MDGDIQRESEKARSRLKDTRASGILLPNVPNKKTGGTRHAQQTLKNHFRRVAPPPENLTESRCRFRFFPQAVLLVLFLLAVPQGARAYSFLSTVEDQTFQVGTAVSVTLPQVDPQSGSTPNCWHTATSYAITPALPPGLSFAGGWGNEFATTLVLSGTPSQATPQTEYTYVGYNFTCQLTAADTFNITVSDPGCRREIDLRVLPSNPSSPKDRVTHIMEGDGATQLNMFAEFVCGIMQTGDMDITVDLAGSADSNTVGYNGPSSVDVTISGSSAWGWTPFTITPVDNSTAETTNTVTMSSTSQVSNLNGDTNWVPINSTSLEIRNDDPVPLPSDPDCRREIDLRVLSSDITSGNRVTHVTEGDGPTDLNIFAEFVCGIMQTGDMDITVNLAGSGGSGAVDYTGPSSVDVTISGSSGAGWTPFTLTPVDDSASETTNTITISSTSQVSNIDGDINWIPINSTSLEVRDDDSGGNTQSVEIQSSPPVSPASSPPPPPPAEEGSGSGGGEGEGEDAENVPDLPVPSGEEETGAGGCALVSGVVGPPSGSASGLLLAASVLLAVSFGKGLGREKAR